MQDREKRERCMQHHFIFSDIKFMEAENKTLGRYGYDSWYSCFWALDKK